MNANEVPVLEILTTFSGECSHVPSGTKILLVRFAGCNFNCSYCDTPDSKKADNPKATTYTIDNLVAKIRKMLDKQNIQTILFTGGEPMLYEQQLGAVIYTLNARKKDKSLPYLHFIIETNGSRFPYADSTLRDSSAITWCVDIKACALEAIKYCEAIKCFLIGDDVTPQSVRDDDEEDVSLAGTVFFKIPVEDIKDFNTVNTWLRNVASTTFRDRTIVATFMWCPVFNTIGKKDHEGFIKQLATNVLDFNPFANVPNMSRCRIGLNFQLHKMLGFK